MKTPMSAAMPLGQALEPCPNRGPVTLDRWEIVSLVTDLRRPLGITDREIMVLRAHLSVLPKGPLDPRTLNMSFMNLQEIHDRACGMDERRFRRGEARLEKIGLIRRQLSANGRRFPERDRAGRIIAAYGIDLSPLFDRYAELVEMRNGIEEERLALRSRKNSLSARLQDALKKLTAVCSSVPEWINELRQAIRNGLRRKTTQMADLEAFEEQVDRIAREAEERAAVSDEEPPAPCPSDWSTTPAQPATVADIEAADDGQSVRHIESKPKEIKKEDPGIFHRDAIAQAWQRTTTVKDLYPDIPRDEREMAGVLFQFSSFIGLGQTIVLHGLGILGWERLIIILDYLAGKTISIHKPEAYLASMIKSYEAGEPIAAGRVVPPQAAGRRDARFGPRFARASRNLDGAG